MENMAANAVGAAEEVVTSSAPAEGSVAATESEKSNAVSPPAPQSEVTETQAFARRLAERSKIEADKQIAAVGFVNHYTGAPITNQRELQAYKCMVEADAAGEDPQYAAQIADMQSMLAGYEIKEQADAIRANPALAPWYEEYHDDVHAILEQAAADGRPISIDSALRAVMAQNIDAVLEAGANRAREEVTKQFQAQSAASPGSVGHSAVDNDTDDISTMSSAQFAEYVRQVKQGVRTLK